MTIRTWTMALSIGLLFSGGVLFRQQENNRTIQKVRQLSEDLQRTRTQLLNTSAALEDANKKLGFLETSKARVQVTAYALTNDFGPDPVFSNNTSARTAYAVPKHTLPAAKVLNVALSPMAEQKLHARLNDTLVLMSRHHEREHLARFVDRTAQTETRPVVDILFANAHEARIWGRQAFYAVNISRPDSPFRLESR
jgi:hypothetical protein